MANPTLIGDLAPCPTSYKSPSQPPESNPISNPIDLSEQEIEQIMAAEAQKISQEADERWREQNARREAEKAQSRQITAEYMRRIRVIDARVEEFSPEWFALQVRQRIIKKPKIKITHHPEKVGAFLMHAYSMRVAADHMQFVNDKYTSDILGIVTRWMTSPDTPTGLVLRGQPGVGKSSMMNAITDVFAIMEGKTTTEVTAMEVAKAGTDTRRMKELADIPMLAIDDLGTEPPTIKSYGQEISPMVDLLTERHRRLRYTIITTNLVEVEANGIITDQIMERYGARLFDRIHQLCGFVKYDGTQKSYR